MAICPDFLPFVVYVSLFPNTIDDMRFNVLAFSFSFLLLCGCVRNDGGEQITGTFEAVEVVVSARESGTLLSFNAEEGNDVAAGACVGQIDTTQLALAVQAALTERSGIAEGRPNVRKQMASLRQQLVYAEREQQRAADLLKDGATTAQQADAARNAVQVLRAQLEALQSSLDRTTQTLNSQMTGAEIRRAQLLDRLSKCRVVSPVGGTILEKYVEGGEFVAMGHPLFKVADLHRLFLRAYVTSAQLSQVKLGQHVAVTADFGANEHRAYDGRVVWISPHAEFTPKGILTDDERADLVYAVKIAVANDGFLRTGMYGTVRFVELSDNEKSVR